jgi:amidase
VTHELTSKACHYTWSARHEPRLRVVSGDTVHFSTRDGFDGQLAHLEDGPIFVAELPVDMSHVAPLTGPIYVEDARPGDCLEIDILDLGVAGNGWLMIWPAWCGFDYHRPTALPDSGYLKKVDFNAMLSGSVQIGPYDIAVSPMLGMIGTAPSQGEFNTSAPRDYGGNLDCRLIGSGARVRLPVFVDGACLSFGDGHAVQGDGELCTTAVECPLEGTLRIRVEHGKAAEGPQVISNGRRFVLAHGRTLDAASKTAIERMCSYLVSALGMEPHEAYMAMSIGGHLAVNQVVNFPYVGVRLSMPELNGVEHG